MLQVNKAQGIVKVWQRFYNSQRHRFVIKKQIQTKQL